MLSSGSSVVERSSALIFKLPRTRVRGSNPAAVLSGSFSVETERSGGINLDPYQRDLFSGGKSKSKKRKSSFRDSGKRWRQHKTDSEKSEKEFCNIVVMYYKNEPKIH